MAEESYLRWLSRHLSKAPAGLKNIITGIPKFLGGSRTELYAGWYIMVGGIIAIAGNIYWNWPSQYTELFGKSYLFGLKNPQWSLIALVGFFLFTHGIYREDKEEEAEG